jgi:hypothetical protein
MAKGTGTCSERMALQSKEIESSLDTHINNSILLPLLFVDVDGVIALFDFDSKSPAPGKPYRWGKRTHHINENSGKLLSSLTDSFELVWATGWGNLANERLCPIIGLDQLKTVKFNRRPRFKSAGWKVSDIDSYARNKPAAWIDDAFNRECREWQKQRSEPTLLVQTKPAIGITDREVELLRDWAKSVT